MESSRKSMSRRKACGQCVRAKRRCNARLPRCSRCSARNLDCLYPMIALSPPPPRSLQTQPDVDFSLLDSIFLASGDRASALAVASRNNNSSNQNAQQYITSPFTLVGDSVGGDGSSSSHVGSSTSHNAQQWAHSFNFLAMAGPADSPIAREDMVFCVDRFKAYPAYWLRHGHAPFIHPGLYPQQPSALPPVLQEAYCACAIYATKTPANSHLAFTILEVKLANLLLSSPAQLSSIDHLACVQALLVFQLIQLFDGDIRQRALAEAAECTLECWTEVLRARAGVDVWGREVEWPVSVAELDGSSGSGSDILNAAWKQWIFAESVRRTVIMSLMIRGIYSLVKVGYCDLGPAVTELSFTGQGRLWNASTARQWMRVWREHCGFWVSGMDFCSILKDAETKDVEELGLLMMVTYKGKDQVEEWKQRNQKENTTTL